MNLYDLVAPLLAHLDPERAHKLTLYGLKMGLAPSRAACDDPPVLGVDILGRHFTNPVGLAAGFDKNAEVPAAMLNLGFGFVETGTVTPHPQAGNPRPRIFRLPHDRAIINRLGFNNEGHEAVRVRLEALRARGVRGIVGVNLGAGRDSADRIGDYVRGLKVLGPLADYVTINISSPNTPGLRTLQEPGELAMLATRLNDARHHAPNTPILVKIAPDLDEAALAAITETALENGIDGLIVSNTTTAREGLVGGPSAMEQGGLSGAPLMKPSTQALARLYHLTQGRLPLVGVGGISSGVDAYAKICAGAVLVQLYTGLVFEGPGLVERIKRELTACLRRNGHDRITGAVGCRAGEWSKTGS